VKRLSVILFSLLLVWAQWLAAPAPPACAKLVHACCHCGGKMSCCAAQPPSGSPSAPVIPSNAGIQNQLSLLVPASWVWALPENEAGSIPSAVSSSLPASGAPLYARDCARLI
jgi:hypothetical protein